MQDKNCNVLRFNKSIMLVALILVCVACGLSLGIHSTAIAYADEHNQQIEDYQSEEFLSLYLDSDYLYDRNEHRNQTTKIQDYESSDFCANGDNAITQIIPKEYFINTCITAKIGKEYGFLIWIVPDARNYHSEVFIFDISEESNTNDEFFYTVYFG